MPLSHDKLKYVRWFVLGALHEANNHLGLNQKEFNAYAQDTIEKVWRYLNQSQQTDATFSDFQCEVALQARQVFGS